MFELITLEDVIRIPPALFDKPLEEAALEVLQQEYEGITDPEIGKIIEIVEVLSVGVGKLIPGDGAAYHPVQFTAMAFKPKVNEIVEGIIAEIVDFGAFIRVGPLDGLCHVSQIADDFFSYDSRKGILVGKTTGRIIRPGDFVRAKIVAVSLSQASKTGKFALTMRHPYLGKLDWINEEIERKYHPEKFEKKKQKKRATKKSKSKGG